MAVDITLPQAPCFRRQKQLFFYAFLSTLGRVEWTGVVLTKIEGPVDGYKVSKAREGFVCLNTFKVGTYSIYLPGYRRDSVTKLWVGSRLPKEPPYFRVCPCWVSINPDENSKEKSTLRIYLLI